MRIQLADLQEVAIAKSEVRIDVRSVAQSDVRKKLPSHMRVAVVVLVTMSDVVRIMPPLEVCFA